MSLKRRVMRLVAARQVKPMTDEQRVNGYFREVCSSDSREPSPEALAWWSQYAGKDSPATIALEAAMAEIGLEFPPD